MNYYIITGTSSGIGEAIAMQLLNRNNKVFCISRKNNQQLIDYSQKQDKWLKYHQVDIALTEYLPAFFSELFESIGPTNVSSITLINNAGVLEPVGFSGTLDNQKTELHFKTNLLAPAILINTFIELSSSYNVPRTIVNISSGAAINPYAGWSNYCASKAALNMLTRAIGMEQQNQPNPVRIFSIAPGIVDTNMQKTIRSNSKEQFPLKEKFEQLYLENKLSEPEIVAKKIITLLSSDFPVTGEIADLRNL
ncbi:MAG: (S)-benzoin forming benzil reductase [Lentimicrobium sp.]|jgi:benzil reductase ((S)-benzoin forming)|nr:(S)-benzoin forming benzil reductase [Lentimicrobium sp.]